MSTYHCPVNRKLRASLSPVDGQSPPQAAAVTGVAWVSSNEVSGRVVPAEGGMSCEVFCDRPQDVGVELTVTVTARSAAGVTLTASLTVVWDDAATDSPPPGEAVSLGLSVSAPLPLS